MEKAGIPAEETTPIKIAYLISAHNDAGHLHRLIKALNIPNQTDFYIHLDKRANLHDFVMPKMNNVKFISERILVQWGGYSQCKYQKALIKECLSSGKNYDRIFFISGLDYPLWNNSRIVQYLTQNPDKELICGMNITECDYPAKIKEKLTLYHFLRDIPVRSGKIKRFFSGSARTIIKLLPFRKAPYIKQGNKIINIYQGSSWWCITGKCLKYIYDHMDGIFENYFKTCFAPDEMMIQTIVFNSPFKEKAILHKGPYPGLVGLTPLHLIEYNNSIKVFDENDYPLIKEKDKMFIRKTISGISDKLLDIIDSERTPCQHR